MRLGFNPHKDEQQIKSDYFHQVVIPVYILNEEYYFKIPIIATASRKCFQNKR